VRRGCPRVRPKLVASSHPTPAPAHVPCATIRHGGRPSCQVAATPPSPQPFRRDVCLPDWPLELSLRRDVRGGLRRSSVRELQLGKVVGSYTYSTHPRSSAHMYRSQNSRHTLGRVGSISDVAWGIDMRHEVEISTAAQKIGVRPFIP